MKAKIIILMVLIVLFTIFVVQNTEPVQMRIFFWQIDELPKIILLTVTLMVGALVGIIITTILNRQKKQVRKKLKPLNSVTSKEEKI